MDRYTDTKHLAFAALTFATALLSAGIYWLTGAWPSEFGLWGSVAFGIVGAVIVGQHVIAQRDVGTGSAES